MTFAFVFRIKVSEFQKKIFQGYSSVFSVRHHRMKRKAAAWAWRSRKPLFAHTAVELNVKANPGAAQSLRFSFLPAAPQRPQQSRQRSGTDSALRKSPLSNRHSLIWNLLQFKVTVEVPCINDQSPERLL